MIKKLLFLTVLLIPIIFFNYSLVFAVSFHNGSIEVKDFKRNYFPQINLLSTHPLGLFISRIENNFQIHPPENTLISLNLSSGNVWLPYVIAYRPVDPAARKFMEGIVWHGRWNNFKLSEMPSDSIQFEADAVIKVIRANLRFILSEKQELGFNIRSFLVTKGQFPFSILTSDKFIESFHSKIKGGDDPFARKYYGFDKAYIHYTDENGKSIELKDRAFIIPGIETSYFYYPDFGSKNNLYMNFGAYLGTNISRFNPSLDLGISATAVKNIIFSNQNQMRIGIGINGLRQKLISFGETVNISNRKYLFSASGQIEYAKQLKDGAFLSIGLNYSVQSQYNNNNENKYQVLIGNRISTHWHYAITHLYRPIEAWNLIFTYSKKYNLSVYIKEDFNVNNAPDVQTGINLQMPFLH